MMTSTSSIMTAAQLLGAGDIGPCELIEGKLHRMTPAGYDHGRIVSRIDARLTLCVDEHRLGEVTGAETGYIIAYDPDTVRAADVAFVLANRVPPGGHPGYFAGPPDLAVEVISPGDRLADVHAKVQQWLECGCQTVWVVNPRSNTVEVHSEARPTTILTDQHTLSGDTLIPGFRPPIEVIFRGMGRE